ncbi:hypothetical protein ACROYT_G022060 [Oculina patagonica]
MGNDNQTDDLQTKSSVNSYLVRWGFCNIPAQVTMPFAVQVTNDETRLYASLYAHSKLWIMDYEVNCARYGCVPTRIQCGFQERRETLFQEAALRQVLMQPKAVPKKEDTGYLLGLEVPKKVGGVATVLQDQQTLTESD